MKLLAISGSLRRVSTSTTLLRAVQRLAPEGVEAALYAGLGSLPHFNPDLEGQEPPSVIEFRARLREASGVLLCSPEYAHGVPGSLKNALDWVVGSGELAGKPIALLNPSPRAVFATASLREILSTMAAQIIPEACVTVSLPGRSEDELDLLVHSELARTLENALAAFIQAIPPP